MPGRRGTTRSPSGAFDTSLVATRVRVLSTEASRAHRVCGDIQLLTKVTRGVSPERNTAITVPVSGLSGGHRSTVPSFEILQVDVFDEFLSCASLP